MRIRLPSAVLMAVMLHPVTDLYAQIASVNTVADLEALAAPSNTSCEVVLYGYREAGDKPPKAYVWNGGSTTAPDGGSILAPVPCPAVGRWYLVGNDPTLNVLDFGAKGDGTFDNTAAFQHATNALGRLGGGTVYVPGGTYNFAGLIVGATGSVNFQGAGKNLTKLVYAGTGIALDFSNNAFSHFSDFDLVKKGARDSSVAIQLGGTTFGNASQGTVFERIEVDGFHWGIHTSNNVDGRLAASCGSETSFRNLTFTFCDVGVYHDDFNALNILFETCDVQNSGTGWMLMLPGVRLENCTGESNSTDVNWYNCTNATRSIPVVGFHSEGSGLFLYAAGPIDVSCAEVLALNHSLQPRIDGLTSSQPAVVIRSSPHPIQCILRASQFAGAIWNSYPADITIDGCVVGIAKGGPSDVLTFRSDFPSASGSRYRITNCRTSNVDLLSDFTAYPDRIGRFDFPSMTDTTVSPTPAGNLPQN